MRIAVTGASGFVGRELMQRLQEEGHEPVAIVRRPDGLPNELVAGSLEMADVALLARGLSRVEAIAHLAARTHVLRDTDDGLSQYRQTNVAGTARLLEAAAIAGVQRFVYMSSVKVNGEETQGDQCFSGHDTPAPEDAYGRTKLEAEQLVASAGSCGRHQTVILRPPMVYGADVGGNFARLVGAVRRGLPLPLGRVNNRRSLISVRNLADAVVLAVTRPRLNGEVLTLSDGEDVSTRQLVAEIGRAVGRPARLLPVPLGALRLAGQILGRGEEVRRLVGNLQVDTQDARRALNWAPREQLDSALRRMLENSAVQDYGTPP